MKKRGLTSLFYPNVMGFHLCNLLSFISELKHGDHFQDFTVTLLLVIVSDSLNTQQDENNQCSVILSQGEAFRSRHFMHTFSFRRTQKQKGHAAAARLQHCQDKSGGLL